MTQGMIWHNSSSHLYIILLYMKKHCHGGARQASDPWTVAVTFRGKSSASSRTGTHYMCSRYMSVYTHHVDVHVDVDALTVAIAKLLHRLQKL